MYELHFIGHRQCVDDNLWRKFSRNDLRDVGGITIVAGEHEFPCSNIVIGPPPPRRPPPHRQVQT